MKTKDITLFGIGLEYRALFDLTQDEQFDEETGELLDESETIALLFDEIQETLSDKLDNSMYIVKQLGADSEALKAESKRLQAKAVAMDNKAKWLKELMYGALNATGEQKLKTAKFSYTIKRSESVTVADVDLLPREYVRLKREADKKLIKEALKEGATIEGCSVDEKFTLGVR